MKTKSDLIYGVSIWGCSSGGRAVRSQRTGQGFESPHLHFGINLLSLETHQTKTETDMVGFKISYPPTDMKRTAEISRKTEETDVYIKVDLDGQGSSRIDTGIPFMDHMLGFLGLHGFMDIELKARGDIEVDYHHTVEDIGICMGHALRDALGDKTAIRRYGEVTIPMDETLVRVVMDLSGRPMLVYRVSLPVRMSGSFDVGLVREFFQAVVNNAGITMHIDLISGDDPHHIAEAMFKAFARALDMACSMEGRMADRIPSTKGLL